MIHHPDAQRWDARYLSEGEDRQRRGPRRLLLDHAHLLPAAGTALDAAAGVGVDSLFLAKHGLHVIALDISIIGLRLAQRQARRLGLTVEFAVWDLSRPRLPADLFDVILNFRFLERAMLPIYRKSLKNGGLLFFETYVRVGEEAENQGYYLEPGELLSTYADYQVLHYTEERIARTENHPARGIARLVARK